MSHSLSGLLFTLEKIVVCNFGDEAGEVQELCYLLLLRTIDIPILQITASTREIDLVLNCTISFDPIHLLQSMIKRNEMVPLALGAQKHYILKIPQGQVGNPGYGLV
jgi:hypothetical protein